MGLYCKYSDNRYIENLNLPINNVFPTGSSPLISYINSYRKLLVGEIITYDDISVQMIYPISTDPVFGRFRLPNIDFSIIPFVTLKAISPRNIPVVWKGSDGKILTTEALFVLTPDKWEDRLTFIVEYENNMGSRKN